MAGAIEVKIIDDNEIIVWDMPCLMGEIRLGDFQETFEVPLIFWKKKDYLKQWREGVERIKTHDKSCLVTKIEGPASAITWWLFYKKGDEIIIRNQFLFGKNIVATIKGEDFTVENCYSFIPPYRKKKDISEWRVKVNDL